MKVQPQQQYRDVLSFWFEELDPKYWFKGNTKVDTQIRERFGETHAAAAACELHMWRNAPEGRLAEIIVLDQFSRNIFRDTAQAFAQDSQALALAQEAVRAGADEVLGARQRAFLYMPFMHSESPAVHEWAMQLFSQPGLETQLHHEKQHKAVIDRFGRYPYRNAVLGRASSDAETAYLEELGQSS